MTNKAKKKFLESYKIYEQESIRLRQEIADWHAKATAVTVEYDTIPKKRDMQHSIEHIVELQSKLAKHLDKQIQVRATIEASIDTIKDQRLRTIMKYRYINCYTWEKVAKEMDYTYQWVCSLHGKALNKIKIVDSN